MKKIYIAYTGGTIGMARTDAGWAPKTGFLSDQLASNPLFHTADMPAFDLVEYDPLLDSSNMTPDNWLQIARDIEQRVDEYDGFVVLHGTDTMAYTASALAFMLENLHKPVILTGSQLPLIAPRTDAIQNLVTAAHLAAESDICEVALFFHDALYRGCRVTKSHSMSFAAFSSPNCDPLVTAGVNLHFNRKLIRVPENPGLRLTVQPDMDPYVGVLWLFPGITGDFVRNLLRPPLKGAVILAFGVGNGPSLNPDFLDALHEANRRGVVLVDCTQCFAGRVKLGEYAAGSGLASAGVVSGYDMTPEAALTKLFYLFGKGFSPEEVQTLVGLDLRGELSN